MKDAFCFRNSVEFSSTTAVFHVFHNIHSLKNLRSPCEQTSKYLIKDGRT